MSIIDIIVNTDISNSEEQFIQIQRHYKSLFVAKGPLSEFFIWDEDFNERIKLNKPLSEIRHRLWEILQ